jgi:hypothetical protein
MNFKVTNTEIDTIQTLWYKESQICDFYVFPAETAETQKLYVCTEDEPFMVGHVLPDWHEAACEQAGVEYSLYISIQEFVAIYGIETIPEEESDTDSITHNAETIRGHCRAVDINKFIKDYMAGYINIRRCHEKDFLVGIDRSYTTTRNGDGVYFYLVAEQSAKWQHSLTGGNAHNMSELIVFNELINQFQELI